MIEKSRDLQNNPQGIAVGPPRPVYYCVAGITLRAAPLRLVAYPSIWR